MAFLEEVDDGIIYQGHCFLWNVTIYV